MRLFLFGIFFLWWSTVNCVTIISQFEIDGSFNPDSPITIWQEVSSQLWSRFTLDQQHTWTFDKNKDGDDEIVRYFHGHVQIKTADIHGGVCQYRPEAVTAKTDLSQYGKYISTSSGLKFKFPEPRNFAGYAVTAANEDYEVQVHVDVGGEIVHVKLDPKWIMKSQANFHWFQYKNQAGKPAPSYYMYIYSNQGLIVGLNVVKLNASSNEPYNMDEIMSGTQDPREYTIWSPKDAADAEEDDEKCDVDVFEHTSGGCHPSKGSRRTYTREITQGAKHCGMLEIAFSHPCTGGDICGHKPCDPLTSDHCHPEEWDYKCVCKSGFVHSRLTPHICEKVVNKAWKPRTKTPSRDKTPGSDKSAKD